ncbi:MAG: hypothetical protein ACLQBY_09155 [Solirubrobacteraceae bacterium]
MSRVAITLDEHALAELGRRAQAAGEPVARTAARLVRDGLLSTQAQAASEPSPAARPAEGQGAGLPGWLEPPDKREKWRRELWATVCALAERYPVVFSKLVADWWKDRALVEVLGALSAWRSQLDAGQTADPRAELLFHDRLELLERRLTQAGDPTAARFAGGPPPAEWIA